MQPGEGLGSVLERGDGGVAFGVSIPCVEGDTANGICSGCGGDHLGLTVVPDVVVGNAPVGVILCGEDDASVVTGRDVEDKGHAGLDPVGDEEILTRDEVAQIVRAQGDLGDEALDGQERFAAARKPFAFGVRL